MDFLRMMFIAALSMAALMQSSPAFSQYSYTNESDALNACNSTRQTIINGSTGAQGGTLLLNISSCDIQYGYYVGYYNWYSLSGEQTWPVGGSPMYTGSFHYTYYFSGNVRKNTGNGAGCDGGEGTGGKTCPVSQGAPMVADPINISNGNEFRADDDYVVIPWLAFRRFYNSNNDVTSTSIGSHWRHSFDRSLSLSNVSGQSGVMVAARPDGKQETFIKNAGQWKAATADIPDLLTEVDDAQGAVVSYTLFVAALRHYETYSAAGLLQRVADQVGQGINLTYSTAETPIDVAPVAGLLLTVTDPQNRELNFIYNSAKQLSKVTLPDGGALVYAYDAITGDLISIQYPDDGTKQYVYSELTMTGGVSVPHALTGVVDEANARYENLTYNGNGQATSSSFAGNVGATQITYNSNGTATVQYPLGSSAIVSFTAVQGGNKVASLDKSCSPQCGLLFKSRTYDSNGYPKARTDFNGVVTGSTYDANGLIDQEVDAVGGANQRTTNITWNTTLRVPLTSKVLDNNGHLVASTSSSYSSTGQLLFKCDADPAVSGALSYACGSASNAPVGVQQVSYTYCNAVDSTQCPLVGLLLTADGPRTDVSDITHYSYYLTTDESGCGTVGGVCHRVGDLYQVADALGHVSTMVAYDKNGRVVRSQDSNNVITDLTYTLRGWLKTRTVGGTTTTIDYDAVGNVIKIIDADGVFIGYTYDAAHRLTDITDAVGNHIHYTLDAAGNKTKEDTYDSGSTLRRTLSRSYNTLGQLTGVIDGLNHTVFNASYTDSYDANGNLVHTADGLGIQRKQGYDALNRLVSTLDNYNGTDTATQNTQATFAYDALDNIEGVTDPDGLSTTYDYDGLSNPKALHSPDTGTTSFQVDAAGNRIQQTDAKGIVHTTTYDAINRPVTVSYPDSTQNIAYHYDEADSVTGCSGSFPIGRLTRIVETAVTTTYCYDNHGNVTKKTQAQGTQVDTTSYSYTAADRLNSITTPSQTVTQYSRDATGHINGVTVAPNGGAGQTVVSAISYLPFGPISSYTLGNGQTITRSYDANYALTDIVSPALNLHFARDVMGNITALGNSPGANPAVETYGYDSLYRLVGVNDPNGNAIEAYTYSKTGDRLSKVKAGGLATGVYGYQSSTHWLTSVGSAARTYDLNGNTIGSANAGETLGYGYNDRNRLMLVQRNQQTVATYVYNEMGERVAKAVTSPQTINERFAYDEASQLIGEYGATNRDYIWLGSLPIAVVDSLPTSAISYVHVDGLGTPRAISDSVGNTIWQWAYQSNSFGEQSPTGSYVYNLRFPGQYYDVEAALSYNISRDYEPATGRYIESDPLGLQAGPSSYGYVHSNPGSWTDPDGQLDTSGPLGQALKRAAVVDAAGGGPEDPVGDALAIGIGAYTLADAIARDANQREVHRVCDEPPPPGLNECDRAKWKLTKALQCKLVRQGMADKWFGGTFDAGHAQRMAELDNEIANLRRLVDRVCKPCDKR